jgi:hypothetical protein
VSDRIEEIAKRANVPEGFVRQLVAAGALPSDDGELGSSRAVRRARLLWSWTAAGLSVETVLGLIDKGALSLAFLDAPVMALPERLDRSYEELAAERGAPMSLVQALHQSLGFAPPEPGDMAGEDDVTMLEVARLFRGAGATDDATQRLLAGYADNLRRRKRINPPVSTSANADGRHPRATRPSRLDHPRRVLPSVQVRGTRHTARRHLEWPRVRARAARDAAGPRK